MKARASLLPKEICDVKVNARALPIAQSEGDDIVVFTSDTLKRLHRLACARVSLAYPCVLRIYPGLGVANPADNDSLFVR